MCKFLASFASVRHPIVLRNRSAAFVNAQARIALQHQLATRGHARFAFRNRRALREQDAKVLIAAQISPSA